jgi:hypothetical protein
MPGIENHPKVQLFVNTVMSRFAFMLIILSDIRCELSPCTVQAGFLLIRVSP